MSNQNSLIIHNDRFEHIEHYEMLAKANLKRCELVKLNIKSNHHPEVREAIKKAIHRIPKTTEVHLNISLLNSDGTSEAIQLAVLALDLLVSKVFLHTQNEALI